MPVSPTKHIIKTAILTLFVISSPYHRQLSVGPEAALSLLVGQLITDALEADPHHAPKHPEQVAMAIAGVTAMQVSPRSALLFLFPALN